MWNVYDKFLHEQVDVNSYNGRRLMYQLDEVSKAELSDKVVSALYKSAVEKYSDIDFGEIPQSKGDITRLKHYQTLTDSIEALTSIMEQTKVICPELDTVKQSLKIVQAYKKEFSLCFIQDKGMGQMIYNTIVLSIICATNLCISAAVDYLRTPGEDMPKAMSVQKDARKDYNVLITNLKDFNDAANSGELRKLFDNILKKDNFVGGLTLGVSSGAIVAGIALAAAISIVPISRELIYFFYNFRMSVSEYFKAQAEFLEINMAEVQASNMKNKPEIVKKHKKRIDQLNKIANKFEVEFNDSNKKAQKQLSKKIDADTAVSAIGGDFSLI